jgi:acetyl esterase/lipase
MTQFNDNFITNNWFKNSNKYPNYEKNINDAYNSCKRVFAKEAILLKSLSILKDYTLELASFAHEYDFPGIPCNGYHTTIDIAIRFMRYGAGMSESDQDYRRMLALFLCGMSFYRTMRNRTKSVTYSGSQAHKLYDEDHHLACESFAVYLDKNIMDGGLGSMIGFYYDPPENIACQISRYFLSCIASGNIWQTLTSFFNANQRRENLRYLVTNLRTDHLKRIDLVANSWYVRNVSVLAMGILHPTRCETIQVPRQTKFKLLCNAEKQTCEIIRRSDSLIPESTVRCRLLYDKVSGKEPDGSLIFHVHGGGFIMGSPDSHETYTRYWMSQIPGVAFISVDYGLSPATQFPESLQQCLDVFFWLQSKECKSIIGYAPKRIVCCGDSSGGLFLMAINCILNDIRIKFPQDSGDFTMPKGFLGIYPSFSCCPRASPSLFLSALHPELMPAAFLSMVTSYVPGPNHDFNNNHRSETQRDTSSRLESVIHWFLPQRLGGGGWLDKDQEAKRPRTNWKPQSLNQDCDDDYEETPSNDRSSNQESKGVGKSCRSGSYIVDKYWWNQSDSFAKKFLDDWKLLSHPYVSPLFYERLDDLKDMPLSLLVCPSDPILDHAISIANKWKGEVRIGKFENMIHGFLPMIFLKGVYLECNDMCVRELKRLLQYQYD